MVIGVVNMNLCVFVVMIILMVIFLWNGLYSCLIEVWNVGFDVSNGVMFLKRIFGFGKLGILWIKFVRLRELDIVYLLLMGDKIRFVMVV